MELVFDIFDRCLVKKFILNIRGIKTNHDQKVKIVDLNYLLTKAEQKYQDIEDWNGSKQEASFAAPEECWNCGDPGHYAWDCPHPDR